MPVPPALLLQAAAPQSGGATTAFFIQIAAIIAIFWFIVIRPQRKQQKELEQSLMAMAKGDEVVTSGGLVGEVVHIKETLKDGKPSGSMGDRVTIRSGESKVVVERGRIVRVSRPGTAG
ncbi:MAG TPA: preprotein translocase subunit YajC [Gemmatimonadaceae bacterium]|nr:preprotein translocase subunit YajC [Gemmatimonadaceae bacterium]